MNSNTKLITKLFFRMIPVQILLVIIGGVNTVIDGAFASNMIGGEAMAITGLFLPINKMLDAVNALMFGGAQILCGRYLGENMTKRTRSVFTIDMMAIMLISVITTLVCMILPGTMAALLGAPSNYMTGLCSYIRGISIGILPFLLSSQLTAFLQLEHQEKRSYIAIGSIFVTNALCNYLFIGVFKMGLFGLGLATSVGNWVSFLIQASYYTSGKAMLKMDIKSVMMEDLPEILKLGLPNAIGQLCLFARSIIINKLLIEYAGSDGMKTYAAINTFGCIYWAVPAGVTAALIMLASVYNGEQDKNGMRILLKTFLTKGIGFVTVLSVFFMLMAVPLTNIFYHDPASAVYKMTVTGFLLFPISSPFSAFTVGFAALFNINRHPKIVHTITIVDGLVAVAAISIILTPVIGINGVWVAQISNGIITCLLVMIYIFIYNRRLPRDITDMLCLPEGFGVPDEKRMDISVASMYDVIDLSIKVADFCDRQGINRRKSNYTALSVEEMAGNIVKHGFSDGKKHSIDIRVSHVNDDVVISMKDNCRPFNPEEAKDIFEPDDVTHNIGIRLVSKMSKRMTYQNTLGLNILTIVI